MPDEPERFYWDSCVLISYLDDTPDRAVNIEAFLGQAQNGKIEIFTSTVSVTEVAFVKAEKDALALDSEIDRKIEALWNPSSPLKLVEYHFLIAEASRQLMRRCIEQGVKVVKPMDAIHLATAMRLGVKAFHTYDGPLGTYAALTGLTITEPIPAQMPIDFGVAQANPAG